MLRFGVGVSVGLGPVSRCGPWVPPPMEPSVGPMVFLNRPTLYYRDTS